MKAAYDHLTGTHLDGAGRLCLRTWARLATGTVAEPDGPVPR